MLFGKSKKQKEAERLYKYGHGIGWEVGMQNIRLGKNLHDYDVSKYDDSWSEDWRRGFNDAINSLSTVKK